MNLTIINQVTNVLVTGGLGFFIYFVTKRASLGPEHSHFAKQSWITQLSVRLVLVLTMFSSAQKIHTPSQEWAAQLLDFGLAFIFIWGSIFHKKYLMNQKPKGSRPSVCPYSATLN
jgi:hypothetical protein